MAAMKDIVIAVQLGEMTVEEAGELLGKPFPADLAPCQQCISIGDGFGPRHEASRRCESGKRPHCTCDTCF